MAHGGFTELGDKAAVVKASPFWSWLLGAIGYLDWITVIDYIVSFNPDGINVVKTMP